MTSPLDGAITRSNPQRTADDYERMMRMIRGFHLTQVIGAVATYSIADELAKGPASAAQIAERRSINPDATARLLRTCTALGLMTSDGHGRFKATPLLDTLRSDTPQSLRAVAISLSSTPFWLTWGRFADAMKTGTKQSVAALGEEIWEYFSSHPDEAEMMARAMRGLTSPAVEDAARVIDTKGVSLTADIGGGSGTLVQALMKANPALQGLVLDLPSVIPSGIAAAAKIGLQDRFRAVAGNFFEAVPAADLYLLKFILHDWDDASCRQILETCRRTVPAGGRLAVIEQPIIEDDSGVFAPTMDLAMMVVVGGRERTPDEYRQLLQVTGWRQTNVSPIIRSLAVIEAIAVS